MKTIEETYYNTFHYLKRIKVADRATLDMGNIKQVSTFKILNGERIIY